MAFDIKHWLKNDLGFTDAEITPELVASFEPKAAKIEGGYLRQSDYSKFVNEYKTKSDQLTQEIADWTEVQTGSAAEATERRDMINQLEKDKLALTQAAKDLAERAGVKLDDVLKGVKVPEPKVDVPVAFDPGPLTQQIGGVTTYLLNLATELPIIMAEHKALTGEDLDPRKLRAEIVARSGRKGEVTDPTAVWEAMYGIPDKRTAKNASDRAAEITAAENRGREAARSEAAIPGATSTGTHAPIFGGDRKSALQRPQPGRNTAGFAQSLAKGTYRNPGRPGAR